MRLPHCDPFQKTAVRGVVSPVHHFCLVFISGEDEIQHSVMIEVGADDSIYGGKLCFHRKDMLCELTVAQVLEPAAACLVANEMQQAVSPGGPADIAEGGLSIVTVEQEPFFDQGYLL